MPKDWMVDENEWERLPKATRSFMKDAAHDNGRVTRPDIAWLRNPRGAWRVHGGTVELPTVLGMSIAGFGAINNYRARGWWGRNRLRLFLIEDPAGDRVLLIAGDIHVGSRWLSERIAAALTPRGLPIERVLLCATHTHSGPGHFYGSDFYDWMAGEGVNEAGGLDRKYWDPVIGQVVAAVEKLATELERPDFPEGRVGYGTAILHGVMWNRSAGAFLANHIPIAPLLEPNPHLQEKRIRHWCQNDAPREKADAASIRVTGAAAEEWRDWGPGSRWVDRKLRCIWFSHEDGTEVGGVAFVGVTPTFIGGETGIFSGDVLGIGGRMAERRLGGIFGCAGGTHGDATAVDDGRNYSEFRAARLKAGDAWNSGDEGSARNEFRAAIRIARKVADALVQAADAARADARSGSGGRVHAVDRLKVIFEEPDIAEAEWVEKADWINAPPTNKALPTRLAARHEVGIGMTKASELDRLPKGEDNEGPLVSFRPGNPHSPRNMEVGDTLKPLLNPMEPPPFYTLHGLQLGSIRIAGVPAEPSTWWGHRLRVSLGDSDTTPVIVAGLLGDYVGYACTREEYFLQQYEAASMLWGRCSGEWALSRYPQAFAEGRVQRRFKVAPMSSKVRISDAVGDVKPIPAQAAVAEPTLLGAVHQDEWLHLVGAWVPPLGLLWQNTRVTRPVLRFWLHRDGQVPQLLEVDGAPAGDETGDAVVMVAHHLLNRHLRFSATLPWDDSWADAAVSFSVEDPALRPASKCQPRAIAIGSD